MVSRKEQPFEGSRKERHSLYLRFPKKLNPDRTLADSEVKSLHPKIIRVSIPRQKSANFCVVDFETKDDKEKAAKKLEKTEVNGKLLVVKEAVRNDKVKLERRIEKVQVKREVNAALGQLVGEIKNSLSKNYAQRNVTNVVMVKHLKTGTIQTDIRKFFPNATDIKLSIKSEKIDSFALVWLPTPKDARTAAELNTIRVNGEDCVVSLQTDGKKRKKQKERKGDDEKSTKGESEYGEEDEIGDNHDAMELD